MQVRLYKIPKSITIMYCLRKNLVMLYNLLTGKKITFRLLIKFLVVKKNLILLTNIPLNQNYNKKYNSNKCWFLYFDQLNLILNFFLKKNFIKIKLNLVGIGYKFFVYSLNNSVTIQIKAGFSHKIFYKLPKTIKVLLLKPTLLIIMGQCYKTILNIATIIKNLRLPDPYKKKGILYHNENIRIKQGKIC